MPNIIIDGTQHVYDIIRHRWFATYTSKTGDMDLSVDYTLLVTNTQNLPNDTTIISNEINEINPLNLLNILDVPENELNNIDLDTMCNQLNIPTTIDRTTILSLCINIEEYKRRKYNIKINLLRIPTHIVENVMTILNINSFQLYTELLEVFTTLYIRIYDLNTITVSQLLGYVVYYRCMLGLNLNIYP